MSIKTATINIIRRILANKKYKISKGIAAGFFRRFGYGTFPKLSQSSEEQFLRKINFTDIVIYDIGAYIGLFSMFFSRATGVPDKVFSFEPNRDSYRELVENLKLNNLDDIHTYNIAIGDQNGELNLSIDPIYPARSTFEKKGGLMKEKGQATSYSVPMFSLDSFIEQKKILKPDFVKIDVEGYEAQVIEGMKKLISIKPPFLYIELHGEKCAKDVVNELLNYKYLVYHVESDKDIDDNNLDEIHLGHIYCKPLTMNGI